MKKFIILIVCFIITLPVSVNSKEVGYGDLKIGDPISKISEYCDQLYKKDAYLGLFLPTRWRCYDESKTYISFTRSSYNEFNLCEGGVGVADKPRGCEHGGVERYDIVKDETIAMIRVGMGYVDKDFEVYKNEIENEYANLKRSLDKKYKSDFSYSDTNIAEFNAGLINELIICYEGCKVSLEYARVIKNENFGFTQTSSIDVFVSYADDMIAEFVFESLAPDDKINTNRF